MKIKSESELVWSFLKFLLKLPFLIVYAIFNKEGKKKLVQPWRDVKEFIAQPKVTMTLIFLNIAGFFILRSEELVFRPSYLFSVKLWPMITSWFMHADLAHLLGNMLMLFVFGRVVERRFGGVKTALVYIGSAAIADIFSGLVYLFVLRQDVPSIGASGAIMGLIATGMLLNPFYVTYAMLVPVPIIVIGWLGIIADISGALNPAGRVNHLAHIGGFLAISILMYLLNADDRKKLIRGFWINIGTAAVVFAAYWFLV